MNNKQTILKLVKEFGDLMAQAAWYMKDVNHEPTFFCRKAIKTMAKIEKELDKYAKSTRKKV